MAAPRTSGEASASKPLGFAGKRRVARVADGDQDVAHEAVAAGALDRRFREQRAKGGVVEAGELGERGRPQGLARRELLLAPGGRELVPRADREAIVASIDAVADRGRSSRGIGPRCSIVR